MDANGNILQSKSVNSITTDFDVDGIYGNIKTIIDTNKNLKTEYQYDSMMERMKHINRYVNNNNNYSTLYNSCNILYNEIGQLSNIVRQDGEQYYFGYDAYGNVTNYKINNQIIQENINDYYYDGKIKSNKYANETS